MTRNMTTTSIPLKIAVVLTIIIIMMDQTCCKALTESTITRPMQHRSGKWFSWKFCGKLNDVCKPDSRKYCCSVGFSCVTKNRQKHFKLPFGKCLPVPTLSSSDIEIVVAEQR